MFGFLSCRKKIQRTKMNKALKKRVDGAGMVSETLESTDRSTRRRNPQQHQILAAVKLF
jgi:hypothetical protein